MDDSGSVIGGILVLVLFGVGIYFAGKFLGRILAALQRRWARDNLREEAPQEAEMPPAEEVAQEISSQEPLEQPTMNDPIKITNEEINAQAEPESQSMEAAVRREAAPEALSPEFLPLRHKAEAARQEVAKQVFGMEGMLDHCLIALLSGGHVLCEGLPGLAKTTLAKAFANVVSCQFKRCQFSPDLLPSDLIGDRIFNQKTNEFDFREGPVFTQILLADEINRSPAKTQAALLEVMQESQVTVFGERHLIGAVEGADSAVQSNRIFFTIATQNPIEQEGTYRLPEAQLDRFMFRLFFQWPERNAELAILRLENGFQPPAITPCFTAAEVLAWREKIAREVETPQRIKECIVDLMRTLRVHPDVLVGAGPRACQVLLRGAKVHAALRGANAVSPSDVRALAFDALNHRVILKPDVVFDHPELSPLDLLRDRVNQSLDTLLGAR